MRTLLAVAGLAVVLTLPRHAIAAANDPVVSVEPACPEWERGPAPGYALIPPTIAIRYNPKAPDARLSSSQTLSLVVANGIDINRLVPTTIPMVRSDNGNWEAKFTRKYYPGYSIFFFRNEKGLIDNNRNQYWEVLTCNQSHIVARLALEAQAFTYEGHLLAPGIQRSRDLARAIEILKADAQPDPFGGTHDVAIWRLELEKDGQTPATYEQIARELDAFLSAHGNSLNAMREVASFVAVIQQKLPASVVERCRATLAALPQTGDPRFIAFRQREVARELPSFEYDLLISNKKDPREKAQAYLAFTEKYPDSLNNGDAYYQAFQCEKAVNDLGAAEAVFEKWTAAHPDAVQPFLEMAQLYIDQKVKPARALELLANAQKIYTDSEAPSSHRHFQKRPGNLEMLRGRAHLLLNDLPGARADFEAAFQADPDDPAIAYALGETSERMGDKTRALAAYLSAASAPYQEDGRPAEAYDRLFVQQRLGTKEAAEQKIDAAVAERTKAAAADYTPMALNRAAPKFAFTDLNGKLFDNDTAIGKPTILTFWGIWCPPCIAEMPSILEFQKQHPEVNMLAVEIGNKPDEVKAFLAAHKLNGLHAAAQADWPSEFVGAGAPTSIVMDRFGQIQFLHGGRIADVEAILGKDVSALPQAN